MKNMPRQVKSYILHKLKAIYDTPVSKMLL